MIVPFLISWGISILFSIAATLFQIPTNSLQGFQFLHLLTNTYFVLNNQLTGVRWYIIVVWVCIFLMISNMEHLFIYLFAIYMFYLEKYLFKSFAHFNLIQFNLLLFLFYFAIELYDFNPLLGRWFAHIFFHSVGWLFPLLCRSCLVWRSLTCLFLLLLPVLLVLYPRNPCQH